MEDDQHNGEGSQLRKRRGHFTSIPNDAIRDTRISIEARGLLAYLLSCSDDWRFTAANVAKVCCVGRDKLRGMMTDLKNHGYLEHVPVKGPDGRMGGWVWIVDQSPDRVTENTSHGSAGTREIPPYKKTNGEEYQKEEIPALSEPDLFAGKGEGKEATKEEGKEEKKQEAPSRLDDAFTRFWSAYPAGPRKTDKPKARAAFMAICAGKAKGIPKTDPEVIIAGAQAYARSAPGEYLKMPVGWLNGARWEGAQAPSPLPPPPAQSDVDLAVQFVPELRGLDHNCLPHHLWHKLEHVKDVARRLKAAGQPLPWSTAERAAECPQTKEGTPH